MTRRSLLAVPMLFVPTTAAAQTVPQAPYAPGLAAGSAFPAQEPDLVRDVVGVAHRDLVRLRQLVDRQPALANATWDWGFGDWESALGAASHVGHREIAEYLISKGARPSVFSAVMLGQLDVVKAFVLAQPGIQRIKGPHGITMLAHATAGGAAAKPVADYLTALGKADLRPAVVPLTAEERAALSGTYSFGPAADQRIEIAVVRETLGLLRPGRSQRGLIHAGSFEFFPVGAESTRIRFSVSASRVTMTIHDPDLILTAQKVTAVTGLS